jgi:uncharacterized protein YdeI (YjbR/CyaY-like superfamily)
MKKSVAKSFSAVLTRSGNSLHWVVIRLPFDSARLWGVRGAFKVKGEINGFAFRSSLFPTGDGHHYMVVNNQMQKAARVGPGMEAQFRMEPDPERKVSPTPPEFEKLLRSTKRLQKFYESLPPSTRNFIVDAVAKAKQPETRLRRAEQAAEHLMEVMEAELELPPILKQAFARNPEAAEGWRRMPPSHRRSHLFGIFGHRNLETRLRRIEKAMADMAAYGSK